MRQNGNVIYSFYIYIYEDLIFNFFNLLYGCYWVFLSINVCIYVIYEFLYIKKI